jgi:hypothetical protein
MGLERPHAEFVGEGKGLAVMGCGLIEVRGIVMRRNVAEEAQGIRPVATCLVRTGQRQGTLGESLRFFQAARQHLRLPKGEAIEHLYEDDYYDSRPLQCLREQRHGVGDAPTQRIRRA